MDLNNFEQVLTSPGVDLTGSVLANRVTEDHVLNPPRYRDRHFIVPLEGPFFGHNVEVYKVKVEVDKSETLTKLTQDVDYVLTHKYAEASYYLLTASPPRSLYASITFNDPNFIGRIKVKYNKLGGHFMHRGDQILALLNSLRFNPRIVTYEQIAGTYVRFPPTNHPTDATSIEFGTTELAAELEKIRNAILSRSDVINPGGSTSPTIPTDIENELSILKLNILKLENNFKNMNTLFNETKLEIDNNLNELYDAVNFDSMHGK